MQTSKNITKHPTAKLTSLGESACNGSLRSYYSLITTDMLPACRLVTGFLDSSVGKESTCNAGDPGLIPGSGRSAGEGIGYALQYSWASLVAQIIKYTPAMWETWVQSLGWDNPLEEGRATHSSILAWRRSPENRGASQSMRTQRVGYD